MKKKSIVLIIVLCIVIVFASVCISICVYNSKQIQKNRLAKAEFTTALAKSYSAFREIDIYGDAIIDSMQYAKSRSLELSSVRKDNYTKFCESISLPPDSLLKSLASLRNIAVDKIESGYYDINNVFWGWLNYDNSEENYDISCAYIVAGVYKECAYSNVQKKLLSVKEMISELKRKYPNYEHTDSLNEYYTVLKSYHDFCCNPNVSYAEAKSIVFKYQNEAETLYQELNFS